MKDLFIPNILSQFEKLSETSRHAQFFALLLCLCSMIYAPCSAYSQTIPPPFINYQAVLYDVNNPTPNAVFSNQSFPTFVNISDELGNLLYREEHYASTDGNGLITVKMGDGLYVAGPITNFNQIDWGTGKYYLVVDFDINGTISSTAPEQLVTVPYSFYAGKAGNGMTSVTDNGNGTLTFTYANGTSYTTAPLTGLQGNANATMPPGTNVGDMYYWNGSSWQLVPIGSEGQFLTVSNGIPSWQSITPNLNLPVVTALNCGAATFSGSIYQSSLLNGITVNVPYAGGNGIGYPAQTIQSVGIAGLTATLVSGVLANGSGVLTYTLSGIAAASGSANFPLVFGGQNCMLSVPIQSTTNNAYPSATVFCASGPTAIVDVTNPSTGKTWMDRNLGASQVASSSTDAASYGDLYQWGRGSDGHQCRTSTYSTVLSSTDQPGNSFFIYTPNALYDWRSPQNDNLWQGVNGTNNPCPTGYRIPTLSEWNAEIASWSSANSTGAFASPLKFTLAGWRESSLAGVATYGRYWSSTAASYLLAGNIFFDIADPASEDEWPRNYGLSVRCIKDASAIPATLGALNCGSTSITGTLTSGTAASGVSASVPYTGGNGGSYAAQTISSTGVTGLTATLATGVLANGSGSLSFVISGTPSASGTASFALTIGGQSCSMNIVVSPPGPAIGQVYLGGIIAYILQPGDAGYDPLNIHGLIAAPFDQGTDIFGCPGNTSCSTQVVNFYNGLLNTNGWASCCGNGATAACYSLDLNGYTDWYLPARSELQWLYENRALIGGFSNDWYWSSSFDNYVSGGYTTSWAQNFQTGSVNTYYNNFNYLKFRAVRKF